MNWMELFKEAVWLPVAYLFDPARRVFIGYLLMSGLIGLCLLYFVHGKSFAESWRELFARRNWWSGSARTDYGLFFIGLCFKAVCIVPYLSVGSMLAYALSMQLTDWLGPRPDASSSLWVAFCYPVVLFLVKDFFVFVTHYYLHRNRYLWEFHKVHHSATVMNPFTLYRMHPVEILLQNLQGMAAFVLVTGLFFYFNNHLVARATIWGVNSFSFLFFIAGANLRHSSVPLKYSRWLEVVLMSPYQHQIHHSDEARFCHSNFGSRLAIWDYWCRTWVRSIDCPEKDLRFGLPGRGLHASNTLVGNLLSPFKGCVIVFRNSGCRKHRM